MNLQNLKEGIWVIRKIHDGSHVRFEGEKIEDLPDIMLRSQFEPYRNSLYKNLLKYIKSKEDKVKAGEIVDLVFKILKKG